MLFLFHSLFDGYCGGVKHFEEFFNLCFHSSVSLFVNVFAVVLEIKPKVGLVSFFQGNGYLVDEILWTLGTNGFTIVGANACAGFEYLFGHHIFPFVAKLIAQGNHVQSKGFALVV